MLRGLLKIKRDIHSSNFFTRKVPFDSSLEMFGSRWRMLKNLITVILTSFAKIQPVIQSMPWTLVSFKILPLLMILFQWTFFTTFKTVPPYPLARYSKNASDMILELFMNNTPIKVLYNDNKWCYSFFVSSFILVFHAVIVSVVRRYLLSDNVLEANMKFSFYLFTLMGEYRFNHIEEENITLMSFWSFSMLS